MAGAGPSARTPGPGSPDWRTRASSRGAIAAVVAALLTLLAAGAVSAPAYGVLLRNSVLLLPADTPIDWAPEQMPSSFLQERRPAPEPIASAARASVQRPEDGADDQFEAAVRIARFIGDNPRRGGAVRGATLEALRRVTVGGEGYCADYTQLFMAFAHASGLTSREWGFGTDGFGAAHAFNEVWSQRHTKWAFVDAFNAFYVVDSLSGVPLSVREFQARLLTRDATDGMRIVRISETGFGFKSDAHALEYFRAGAEYFYLFWGNNVFSYDQSAVVRALSPVSRTAEILAAAALGVQPRIAPVATPHNARAIRELRMIRVLLGAGFVVGILLGLCLLWQARQRLVRPRLSPVG